MKSKSISINTIINIAFTVLLFVKFLIWLAGIIGELYLISNLMSLGLNCLIIILGLFSFKNEDYVIKSLSILICILFFISTLYMIYVVSDSHELYFKSPLKSNVLIISEISGLNNGYAQFYQRKYFLFKRKIPCNSINGYKIFSSGRGHVEWISESELNILYPINDRIDSLTLILK